MELRLNRLSPQYRLKPLVMGLYLLRAKAISTITRCIMEAAFSWPKEALRRRQIQPIGRMYSCAIRLVGRTFNQSIKLTLLSQECFQHDTSTYSVLCFPSSVARISRQLLHCICTVVCILGGSSRGNSDR